ncbi:MAG: sn-glycerol-1-phosphate dehydrogenase [Firmicutes bacterium]|nr:sn-glycerol-1-phosphate dehydrogenase [Bacillota bacterium]
MRIDGQRFGGACSCGKTHEMTTKLSVIEAGALLRFNDYIDELGLDGDHLCVIYDSNTYQAVPKDRRPKAMQEIILDPQGLHANEFSTAEVFEQMVDGITMIAGVGGGTVNDIARFCGYKKNLPLISIPTAASCDAFGSDVAAMTWEGLKKSISCLSPVLVVADLDIIKAAPSDLILSGIGDMLGKFIALAEWKIAHAVTGEAFCQEIHDIMDEAVTNIMTNCKKAQDGDDEAVAQVMYGLLMSGIAMQMFGNSRPASGAEHHISHFIEIETEAFGETSDASHGEKVGVGTVLASAEYHRLTQIEDIAPYVIPYQPFDKDWVRSYVGERLYEPTLKEHENDALAKVTPEALISNWPKIRQIVSQIPTAEQLYDTLAQLGAKRSLSDIGISEDKLAELLDNSPLARNRLTLMRMRRMMTKEVR